MLSRLYQLAETGDDFAFETTLASRSFAPWIAKLKTRGYHFHLVFLTLSSADIAIARVAERVRMGGYDVPTDTIQRRFVSGIRNVFDLYQPMACGAFTTLRIAGRLHGGRKNTASAAAASSTPRNK